MGYEPGLLAAGLIVLVGAITMVIALVRRQHNKPQPTGAETSARVGVNPGPGSRATLAAGVLIMLIGASLAVAMIFWNMDFMLAVALPVAILIIPVLVFLVPRWVRMLLSSREN